MYSRLAFFLTIFVSFTHAWVWDEFDSSSSNWTLTDERRKYLRQHGYCIGLCGLGSDEVADGLAEYMNHFYLNKDNGKFRELTDFIMGELNRGELTDKLDEVDYGDRDVKTVARFVDIYCEDVNIPFDDCLSIKKHLIFEDMEDSCLQQCWNRLANSDFTPEFDSLPIYNQEHEKCLDEFKGPGEFFDYNDKESASVENLLESFRRNGFLFIKNFLTPEFSAEVTKVVNDWHEAGTWKNHSFADFYSHFEGQLSKYEFRKEFVLPYEEPFKTILSSVHNSSIMEVIRAYGNYRQVNLDFPATIMSYHGAEQQRTHGDHGYECSMVKVGIAIHDIYEISGPTSFCPCTQHFGMMKSAWNKPCGIRYHPDFIPAGTAILYDMVVKHRGSENNGGSRRYLIDLSYSAGEYFNRYQETYPEVAQEYVLMYREKFKNL